MAGGGARCLVGLPGRTVLGGRSPGGVAFAEFLGDQWKDDRVSPSTPLARLSGSVQRLFLLLILSRGEEAKCGMPSSSKERSDARECAGDTKSDERLEGAAVDVIMSGSMGGEVRRLVTDEDRCWAGASGAMGRISTEDEAEALVSPSEGGASGSADMVRVVGGSRIRSNNGRPT